jgi:hypothetical protein
MLLLVFLWLLNIRLTMLLSVFVVVAQTEEKQEYAKKKRTE